MDIAGLTFSIDSSQANTAKDNLSGMASAADQAASSTDQLRERHERFIAVTKDLTQSLAEQRRQFQETTDSLQGAIEAMDRARDAWSRAVGSFSVFQDARTHVEALGQAFAATSTGLDQFVAKARQLQLDSGETVIALQRITDAIQNMTPGGMATRGLLNQLGIDPGGDPNNAANVLQQIYQRLSSMQDSVGKYRDAAELLGPLTPDDYARISAPQYETIPAMRNRLRQEAAQQYNDTTLRNAALGQSQTDLDTQQFDDLGSYYDLSRLTDDQRVALARRAGISVDQTRPSLGIFAGRERDLPALRYLRANPNDPAALLASFGRNPNDLTPQTFGGALYQHYTDGSFTANIADINRGYSEDLAQLGYFPALGNSIVGQLQNLFPTGDPWGYRPRPYVDGRTPDPNDAIMRDQAAARRLANYGYDDLSAYQSASSDIRDLQPWSTRMDFVNAYGWQEGQARYFQTLDAARARQGRALTPASDQIADLQSQGYYASLPVTDRARAGALQRFMGSNGIPGNAAALYGSGMSLDDAISQLLTPGQRGSFNTEQGISYSTNTQIAHQDAEQSISEISRLAAVASQGAAAVETLKTQLDTENSLLDKNQDKTKAVSDALSEMTARRREAAQTTYGDEGFANEQSQRLFDAVAGAGPGAASRAGAQLSAGLTNDILNRQRSNPEYDAATLRRLGIDANALEGLGTIQGRLGTAQDAYTTAQARLAGSIIGGGTGASLEQQVQNAQELAKAYAEVSAKGGDAVETFNDIAGSIGTLSDRATQLKFDAENFAQARSLEAANNFTAAGIGASGDQRQFLGAVQQVYQANAANPALSPLFVGVGGRTLPDIDQATQQQINSLSARFGVDPATALAVLRNEGGGDPNNQNPFSMTPAAVQAAQPFLNRAGIAPGQGRTYGLAQGMGYLAYLQTVVGNDPRALGGAFNRGPSDPAFQHFMMSGMTDTSQMDPVAAQYERNIGLLSPEELQAAERANPGTSRYLSQLLRQQNVNNVAQETQAQQSFTAQSAASAAATRLIAAGQPGAAQLAGASYRDPTATSIAAQGDEARRIAQVQQDQARTFAETTAQIKDQTDASNQLAAAWSGGAEAAAAAERANAAYKDGLADLSNPMAQQISMADRLAQARAQESEANAKDSYQTGQTIDANNYQVSLGIGSSTSIDRAMTQYRAQQYANNNLALTPDQGAGYVNNQMKLFDSNQQVQGMNQVNEAAKQMGDTLLDTFQRASQGGQSFKHILGDLVESIGDIIEKLVFQKPLENLFSNLLGGLFGGNNQGLAALGNGNWIGGAFGGGVGGLGGIGGLFSGASAVGIDGLTDADLSPVDQAIVDPNNELGIYNSVSSSGGFFSGIGSALGGAWNWLSSGIAGLFATGDAFMGGRPLRYHATGSILNVPTAFTTADGGMNYAGEAGDEAILPLRRLPNGNLGVGMDGGGGGGMSGPGIIVQAPITFAGGTNSNGSQMDAASAAALQRHIMQVVNNGIAASVLNMQRPGGSLWNAVRASQGQT